MRERQARVVLARISRTGRTRRNRRAALPLRGVGVFE